MRTYGGNTTASRPQSRRSQTLSRSLALIRRCFDCGSEMARSGFIEVVVSRASDLMAMTRRWYFNALQTIGSLPGPRTFPRRLEDQEISTYLHWIRIDLCVNNPEHRGDVANG